MKLSQLFECARVLSEPHTLLHIEEVFQCQRKVLPPNICFMIEFLQHAYLCLPIYFITQNQSTTDIMELNLFGTGLSERGCRALVAAVATSRTLTRLNLQFNALKGRIELQRLLEAAAKMRRLPLSLAL